MEKIETEKSGISGSSAGGAVVRGHSVFLDGVDGKRRVFLGLHPDRPGQCMVIFANEEGIEQRLALSDEAIEALWGLYKLRHDPGVGGWRQVSA